MLPITKKPIIIQGKLIGYELWMGKNLIDFEWINLTHSDSEGMIG